MRRARTGQQASGTLFALLAALAGCAGGVPGDGASGGPAAAARALAEGSGAAAARAESALAAAGAKKTCATRFPESPWPTVPAYGNAIAAADFNGDGHPDLVALDPTGVQLLLAKGGGRFDDGVLVVSASYPEAVLPDDFDGDGVPDLLVLYDNSYGAGTFRKGHGDGTFGAAVFVDDAIPAKSAQVADLNGDGVPDLFEGDYGARAVVLGNGDGTFRYGGFLAAKGMGLVGVSVALADFNGDGHPDLVSLATGHQQALLLGKGDGTWQAPTFTPAPAAYSFLVAAGDLNGDGAPDLVVTTYVSGAFQAVPELNSGKGTFTPGTPAAWVPQSGSELSTSPALQLVDVDGDGHLDLLQGTAVAFGKGDGSFGKVDALMGRYVSAVAVHDLDGDGLPDVALASMNDYVGVLLGEPHRKFGPLPPVTSIGGVASALAVGDFDGDGRSDLAVARADAPTVDVLLSTGTGLGASAHFAVHGVPGSLAAGDLDGDGMQDLVATLPASTNLSVLLGRRHGTFGAARSVPVGAGATAIAIADLDGDGHADLAVATLASAVEVLLGAGDGSFGALVSYPVPDADGAAIVVGDFNGDGKPDLAVATGTATPETEAAGFVDVLLGSGAGTFTSSAHVALPGMRSKVTGFTLGDFNGDGRPDLVASWSGAYGGDSSYLLAGLGRGAFAASPVGTGASAPVSLVSGDFNGGKALDLAIIGGPIAGQTQFQTVRLFGGAGDGTLAPLPGVYPTIPQGLGFLAAGDFNGDGLADLAGASATSDGVTLLLNGVCP